MRFERDRLEARVATRSLRETDMKRPYVLLLLLGVLLLCTGASHAEGNCPDGYYPIGGDSPGAPQGCAPIPGYGQGQQQQPQQQQAPQHQWASMFGAVATDSNKSKGVLGIATNKASRSDAEQAALADCKAQGGDQCVIDAWYTNGCAAMVVGHPGYTVKTAPTESDAVQAGMSSCTGSGYTNCHLYYSGCSPPRQIQ